ncbi:chromosome segregation protein SMC [Bradyrhizobium nanningense]|uniref:ATP-dependent nuclease n=1 Tax=Bradyrhizobium nanningense TaxID=1325118 RepID=UPI001008BE93|nr:AAA family ATPase [Bradyrhizobium nanningense]RXH33579.1 chromosome segregation protein SMC [Bradyrhizobium nanningense]
MKLVRLRLSNFRSFSADCTELELDDLTFLLGPNGTGKTAILQALARMFSLDPAQRKVKKSDFHIPHDEKPEHKPAQRELWIEVDFEFPELLGKNGGKEAPAVPGNFAHMQLTGVKGPAQVRFRLKANIDQDDDIEESFTFVIKVDGDGHPVEEGRVAKHDRNAIQVHYLPARRDPADHISYSANALLGRALRSANWAAQREKVSDLTVQINSTLAGNGAIEGITSVLSAKWTNLHKGNYFVDPSISFARSELENLLRHLSIGFAPGHGEELVDFSRLSDGQQSILYLSIVLGMHDIGTKALRGELTDAFDIDKLRPAIFTLIAIEEPENSLSPHYLGRVVRALREFAQDQDAQALLATHSPSLMRRVPPENIRYMRLSSQRTTVVKRIDLPDDEEALKFVREGVQAFPELYFSRFVVLGEGDSEEVVLPRLLAAKGILADDASISVVPLGGRHVNHFWRLLHGLGIPHVTLLDLDLARHQGGWGRMKYAAKQLLAYSDVAKIDLKEAQVKSIPKWDDDQGLMVKDDGWFARLEEHGVFYSSPLDLDFLMMTAYPKAYRVADDELEEPDEDALKAVLGKKHDVVGNQYTDEQLKYFDAYNSRFKLGSKPAWHIRAMANLADQELLDGMPKVLERLFKRIRKDLKALPE